MGTCCPPVDFEILSEYKFFAPSIELQRELASDADNLLELFRRNIFHACRGTQIDQGEYFVLNDIADTCKDLLIKKYVRDFFGWLGSNFLVCEIRIPVRGHDVSGKIVVLHDLRALNVFDGAVEHADLAVFEGEHQAGDASSPVIAGDPYAIHFGLKSSIQQEVDSKSECFELKYQMLAPRENILHCFVLQPFFAYLGISGHRQYALALERLELFFCETQRWPFHVGDDEGREGFLRREYSHWIMIYEPCI